MGWCGCHGRECKLGWGWNEPLDRLIPVEEDPPNVTSQAVSEWEYGVYPLSSTNIVYWPWISLLLEPSCKKQLDFQIVFDDNQYWAVNCHFSRRREGSEKFSKYPSNCSHFIRHIDYGVHLWIYFPKTEFPGKDDEKWKHWDNPITALFKDRNLTETQKNTKCRVMINFNEIREMTLRELLKFMRELDEGKYSQYDIPVGFEYEKFTRKFRETVVSNEGQFGYFLSALYCVYRKIEMKMEKAGYPNILPDLDSQEQSFTNICSNLNKAKQEYKSMDRNDFLKMYPVLKKLFFCYTDYIRYAIDHEDNIDEGDHLLDNWREIKPWLQKLNNWTPKKFTGESINYIGFFIATPPDYDQVVETLRATTKFRDTLVIKDNKAVESYITDENNKKILFGFVDMKRAEKSNIPNNAVVFESECPEECIQDVRKWICFNCGDFVFQKGRTLFCSCGSKKYKDELLTCHHPSHRSQNQAFNPDDLLPSIYRQLEQIQIRTEGTTDRRILIAITSFKNNKIQQIETALTNLQGVSLDANTRHMIDLYLNRTR